MAKKSKDTDEHRAARLDATWEAFVPHFPRTRAASWLRKWLTDSIMDMHFALDTVATRQGRGKRDTNIALASEKDARQGIIKGIRLLAGAVNDLLDIGAALGQPERERIPVRVRDWREAMTALLAIFGEGVGDEGNAFMAAMDARTRLRELHFQRDVLVLPFDCIPPEGALDGYVVRKPKPGIDGAMVFYRVKRGERGGQHNPRLDALALLALAEERATGTPANPRAMAEALVARWAERWQPDFGAYVLPDGSADNAGVDVQRSREADFRKRLTWARKHWPAD
jgi:hypothetical protein